MRDGVRPRERRGLCGMAGQIPEFLENMLKEQYGEADTARILKGYAKRRPVTLRVNTLKTDAESVRSVLEAAGIRVRGVSWSREAFILENAREDAVRKLDVYQKGEIYLQSLSSMIPPVLLDPRARECILDMAAAPGGKTTQMAALSGGRAQITACEKNRVRAERLRFNLDRQGAAGVVVMNEDARKLDPFFSFDKILLDAPCSGSGTLYAPDGGEEGEIPERAVPITRELIDRSARTQEALLRKALSLLKPGHEMVYSTCSVLKTENERVLNSVLPSAKAAVVPIGHPMIAGLPLLPAAIRGVLCICPTDLYEGFFVAKIRKA